MHTAYEVLLVAGPWTSVVLLIWAIRTWLRVTKALSRRMDAQHAHLMAHNQTLDVVFARIGRTDNVLTTLEDVLLAVTAGCAAGQPETRTVPDIGTPAASPSATTPRGNTAMPRMTTPPPDRRRRRDATTTGSDLDDVTNPASPLSPVHPAYGGSVDYTPSGTSSCDTSGGSSNDSGGSCDSGGGY